MVEWFKVLASLLVVPFGFWFSRKLEHQKKEHSSQLAAQTAELTLNINQQLERQRKENSAEIAAKTAELNFSFNQELERQKRDHSAELAARNAELNLKSAQQLELQKKEHSAELALRNSELTKSVQHQLEIDRAQRTEALEHLKRDLQDTLAQRARRADYLRAQLDKLYGPLAFLLESNARCIEANADIMKAYDEYFKKFPNLKLENGEDEIGQVIETANRYAALVVENNKEAIKILRTGWGWLDKDDIEDAGQYLADIARHDVEFKEKGRRLPSMFYSRHAIQNAVEPPAFFRPTFVERVRSKLREKQAELSGLTGGAAQEK